MRAKNVAFDVTYINLRDKPDWFLEISPHGKVPVLKIGSDVLFESNAIAEFVDETVPPRLHPEDPVKRARNRAWTDYVPNFSRALVGVYHTASATETEEALAGARTALGRLESALAAERGNGGPYFNGPDLSLVDAAYAPFLQRFTIADGYLGTDLLAEFPKVRAWTDALLSNDVVTGAVPANFVEEFHANLKRRKFHVASLFADGAAAE